MRGVADSRPGGSGLRSKDVRCDFSEMSNKTCSGCSDTRLYLNSVDSSGEDRLGDWLALDGSAVRIGRQLRVVQRNEITLCAVENKDCVIEQASRSS